MGERNNENIKGWIPAHPSPLMTIKRWAWLSRTRLSGVGQKGTRDKPQKLRMRKGKR